jgi:PKD repeat protein
MFCRRFCLILFLVLLGSCAQDAGVPDTDFINSVPGQGLSGLPVDGVQPWERTDSKGFVRAAAKGERTISAFPGNSELQPGIERFLEGGTVTDLGEASSLSSGTPGSNTLSWAMYRLVLGGAQPGAISVDAQLPAGGQFWVALSDYARNAWQWHGPFSEAQVTLLPDAGDYTSELGNTFIAIAVHDGAAVDVVSVMAAPRNTEDATAPPTPAAPAVTPVAGGLELAWVPVVADDIAGYRVCYSFSPFDSPDGPGVQSLPFLEGTTRQLVPGAPARLIWVGLTAVDVNGNESALSPTVVARPLAGSQPALQVTASALSGERNASIVLTATGADSYDFDTDGDGTFDITGDTGGTAAVDTTSAGLIRPRVRATSGDGTAVALGSVSLFISGNSRPVASARVDPQSGPPVLAVTFFGEGADEDGTIVEYLWDRTGDGIYERSGETTTGNFSASGLFNAKLRVTDDQGAWDTDTVSVLVLEDPQNMPPQVTSIAANPSIANPDVPISFTAAAADPDGTIVSYEWDFDNDGSFDSEEQNPVEALTAEGLYNVKLRVTDDDGGTTVDSVSVMIQQGRVGLSASPNSVYPGETIELTASLSEEVTAIEWDLDGNGSFETNGGEVRTTVLGTPGVYSLGIHVTFAGGDSSTATTKVTVRGAVTLENVDKTGEVDTGHVSMVMLNGRARIAYEANGNLYYQRALDANGATWTDRILVDDGGANNVGAFCNIEVIASRPAISYMDDTADDLKYVRAGNIDGSTWGTPVLVDAAASFASTSLEVVAGNPAIGYVSGGNIAYIRASTTTGGSWLLPELVDAGSSPGYTSLAVVNGRPAMAFHNAGNLQYNRAIDDIGSGWPAAVDIDAGTDNVGHFGTTMLVVDGNPAISYFDGYDGDMMYIRATDADGGHWPSSGLIIDGEWSTGFNNSMTLVGGIPVVAYHSNRMSNLSLRIARALNPQGSAWGAPVDVHSIYGWEISSTAIVDQNGRPGVIDLVTPTGSDVMFSVIY